MALNSYTLESERNWEHLLLLVEHNICTYLCTPLSNPDNDNEVVGLEKVSPKYTYENEDDAVDPMVITLVVLE